MLHVYAYNDSRHAAHAVNLTHLCRMVSHSYQLDESISKFRHIGAGRPRFNQYFASINVSCSRTQGSDAGEARTRGSTVSSQALYH